jgi:hypothetical protein
MPTPRLHPLLARVLAALGCFAVLFALGSAFEPRMQSMDSTPGRFGALTRDCRGSSNLGLVEPMHAYATQQGVPWFVRITKDGKGLASAFGPGPEYLGAWLGAAPRKASAVDEATLYRRAQLAATAAVAAAASLLFLALAADVSIRLALLGAFLAGLSFAGLPSLGQSLWQQTSALPPLLLSLALAAFVPRMVWMLPLVAACASLAASLRPADAPLCLGVLVFATLSARPAFRNTGLGARLVAACVVASALGALPTIAWHWEHFGELLPLGQLAADERLFGQTGAFSGSPLGILEGALGLTFSPARGLVFFAPLGLLAFFLGWRSHRTLAIALGAQFLVVAAFRLWWGGTALGPRLLAGAYWIGLFVVVREIWGRWASSTVRKRASGDEPASSQASPQIATRVSLTVFSLLTVYSLATGSLLLARHDLRKWEHQKNLELEREAIWSFRDSPWQPLFTLALPPPYPPGALMRYCVPGDHFVLSASTR